MPNIWNFNQRNNGKSYLCGYFVGNILFFKYSSCELSGNTMVAVDIYMKYQNDKFKEIQQYEG